ncbi:hypothetical protein BDV34DRAFT_202203 [Aspergillus parasiticus]|uniref:Uncharacterized protein n=1 Tax=Aspergillus parasiticus TaxID=5067 RepID=A0A5N6D907_ASPPA|nr:hypothetical protein BDV34DRAFT_202203 [Aspergillus parasiticus]
MRGEVRLLPLRLWITGGAPSAVVDSKHCGSYSVPVFGSRFGTSWIGKCPSRTGLVGRSSSSKKLSPFQFTTAAPLHRLKNQPALLEAMCTPYGMLTTLAAF